MITPSEHKMLCRRVHPTQSDVLLRKVGVGARFACVVPQLDFDFSIFVSVALIRTRLNPYYLSSFINSKYGQRQLLRFNKGISQPDLHLEDIGRLLVPLFSVQTTEALERSYLQAQALREQSEALYESAGSKLLFELSFEQAAFSRKGVTEKRLSESFGLSGRLDAEYYQPKYDDLFAILSRLPTKPLGDITTISKSIEPGSEYYGSEGIPFIRVSDVSAMGIEAPTIKIPKNVVPSIETLYPKKDTILFSKDGSVGIAYKMEADMEAVTSGALLHLHVKNTDEVLPDYLTLVLNSEIVRLQAERDASGAIIQHWKPGDIAAVTIPLLPYEIQAEIAQKVQESFALRRQSEALIEKAVRAVEIAIEEDESAAVAWLGK